MGTSRAIAVVAALLLAACHRSPGHPPVVAWIGQDPVYAPELKAVLDSAKAQLVPHRDGAEAKVEPDAKSLAVLRRTVLDELVDRRLLLARAKAAGIDVPAGEVKAALAEGADGGAPDGPGSPRPLLVRDELVIDRFLVREVAARVAVTPAEERAFYDRHPELFTRPEQVRCSQLLAPTREAAQALAVRLSRGEAFAKVASEASTSIDRAKGGDLGWFGKGEMPPALEQACFALKKGQVSPIVQSPYGFHLVQLTDRRPAGLLPFPQVEERLNLRLTREKVAKAEAGYLEKLRRAAKVSYVQAEIDKVT